MKSSEIRKVFADYFQTRGHQVVSSSSLIPTNDPTLLFTNAGMVQFKDVFLGEEKRTYKRAATIQRCVRAGGKHNDLENVGYTARHHTFFEMLGNFSFGDYFKREAITYAWEFLTEVLHLSPEKLWITVYIEDDEAADIWLKDIGVSSERFSRCDEDNFWSMGDTGPCGPSSEIFYDHGEDIPGGPPGSSDADADRYVEIWNLVFMQYNRDKEGHLHPLPKPSVDTGMGLERVAAVVQGVHNNYDIDIFQYLIASIRAEIPEVAADNPSLKVIADHIRACAFLITDTVMPSNEGRGYVLRRIIRRALRHGNKLGLPCPFFYKLVTPLIEVMGETYPELSASKEMMERVLLQEENQFVKTLEQGLQVLQEHLKELKTPMISGDLAFKLYDTYGFPLDLTEDLAREQGLSVDVAEFNQCMQNQRDLSLSASQFAIDYSQNMTLTEASCFHGYDKDEVTTKVLAILLDGKKVSSLEAKEGGKVSAAVILENTPYYAESGGQVGDRGQLQADGLDFRVLDTKKIKDAIIHYGELQRGVLQVEQQITASIDKERRAAIRMNHTATHLLHAALKNLIGSHVQQKGSLVDAERARFDFSHFETLTKEQLSNIEDLVNARIRANDEVATELMSLDKAKNSGAQALFGEKYADEVRVLSIADFSKELCGGTHVRRTGDIGLFKIIAEYGIASGIRRLDFLTGAYACQWVNEQSERMEAIADRLKTSPMQLIEKLDQILQEAKLQEKELTKQREKLLALSGADYLKEVETLDSGIHFLAKAIPLEDGQALRTTFDQLKGRIEKGVIILYTLDNNRINVLVGISKELVGVIPSAVVLVKHLCGKGGGREDMAQGGGEITGSLELKMKEIKEMLLNSRA